MTSNFAGISQGLQNADFLLDQFLVSPRLTLAITELMSNHFWRCCKSRVSVPRSPPGECFISSAVWRHWPSSVDVTSPRGWPVESIPSDDASGAIRRNNRPMKISLQEKFTYHYKWTAPQRPQLAELWRSAWSWRMCGWWATDWCLDSCASSTASTHGSSDLRSSDFRDFFLFHLSMNLSINYALSRGT